MKDKNTVRAYIMRDADNKVVRFAFKNQVTKQEAYNTMILNYLDTGGNLKNRIILTKEQLLGVDEISKSLGQSPIKTVQDLVDCALLLFGTDLTLRDALVFSVPLLKERLKDINPELAKEILKK
ncbi:MAG: hypothetical protein Q8J68_07830 [Methanolobus sp.]|uniref:hypothetical protein n=1 Tax=Methanolobus sp. TaxID=1874737 RepID=UPI0027302840|nr:hypothetical protein [Methanolobus sp.]MDP2217177.1 hypothetical protein [Methanolobus sp.]